MLVFKRIRRAVKRTHMFLFFSLVVLRDPDLISRSCMSLQMLLRALLQRDYALHSCYNHTRYHSNDIASVLCSVKQIQRLLKVHNFVSGTLPGGEELLWRSYS